MLHHNWIEKNSGYPAAPRTLQVIVHAGGDSVIGLEGMDLVFSVFDVIRETSGYEEICGKFHEPSCYIVSPTGFWNHSRSMFHDQAANDEDVVLAMSQSIYPVGLPVDHSTIIGNPSFDKSGLLRSSPALMLTFNLPPVLPATKNLEGRVLVELLEVQESWRKDNDNKYRLEFFAARSFSDEFSRAIVRDIPLVAIAFVVTSMFTSLVFWKRDRTILGFGAICTVLLAIMTSYGILFAFGVPFTSLTQILPFIMFGIGVDNAFIMTGSFMRTCREDGILRRIEAMITDVGVSITITSSTSVMAFAFGCTSSIPAVTWLCLYAFPTIIVNFAYQITFFVAILALDEQRILDSRSDCLCCVKLDQKDEGNHDADRNEETTAASTWVASSQGDSLSDRIMAWYADKLLLNGWTKSLVVFGFTALVVGCAYSASMLDQQFDFTKVIPKDSYITPFFHVMNEYTALGGAIVNVYFRNVDQSFLEVRQQMDTFVNDLVEMRQIESQPSFFWIRDSEVFLESNPGLQGREFQEQFEMYYNTSVYHGMYCDHIDLDPKGLIRSSRTTLFMNKVNGRNVQEVVGALEDQYAVSSKQPANHQQKELSFFTYSELYLMWEFYSVAVQELISSSIIAVVSVVAVATISMPHWTALFFVFPLMCILYVDLLGILQVCGVSINPVSYISVVMSVGLLVDFVFHILLRFYEVKGDRTSRTKEMLRTIGSSMMLAGLSTFLGVLPLAFSTSTIFFTIFVTFMALVALGLSHSLVLMPVLFNCWS